MSIWDVIAEPLALAVCCFGFILFVCTVSHFKNK